MEIGDIVRLKSGGPVMTVALVDPVCVVCVWFDEHQSLQQASFKIATLELPIVK